MHLTGTTTPSTPISEVPETSSGLGTPRPIGRNAAKSALRSNAIESRRAEALERIAAASEKKNHLFEEYTAALKQQNMIKVATARLEGLDPYSAKILLLEKQRLLEEMSCSNANDNFDIISENDELEPEQQMYVEFEEGGD